MHFQDLFDFILIESFPWIQFFSHLFKFIQFNKNLFLDLLLLFIFSSLHFQLSIIVAD